MSSRLAFVAGAVLGALLPGLVIVVVARTVTGLYDGLDGDGTYGIAVAGTRDLAAALDRYRARHHRIPGADEGLAGLAPEFVPAVEPDPWGNAYLYEPTNHDWADVLSYGADGRPGGSGTGSDVSARFGRLGPRPPRALRTSIMLVLVGLPLAAALAPPRWCAGALAGMAVFWGGLLLAMVGGSLVAVLTPISALIGIASLVGALALAWELPYARLVALLAVVITYMLVHFLLIGG